ncbi:IclR family transcriptional regulator domain-containing protein [Streptomyces arenae]|uniref:IclR family transcriptional regulator domain-containing protein n=1 Tax=Streptomyces arenae TaxID=29301 RepID=UPI0026590B79|nr:IclR family transcriptional regulator C-terminal domain-containing protein [Streptomyces arenae]MCG7207435.1 helix-turn-helix domain-containing protein [Streptomyces arenae]
MTDERRDHLQTLERGLSVIAAFTGSEPLMGLAELGALTGLSKPIVRRILLTLERLGYARSTGGRFALTPKVLELGYAYLSSVRLTDTARPLMEELTSQLGVGTSLAALDGADIVYLDRTQRGRVTSVSLAVGTRLPAHATSLGHVLLAYAPSSEIETILADGPLPALTEWTLTDPKRLRDRLTVVRARGWDAVDQELEVGRRSASAPVFDSGGRAVAALALSCSTLECSMEQLTGEFLPPLQAAARAISEALGAGPHTS